VADWNPDAVIPASGLPAWPEPDGSAPPATQLQAGVEVRIAERRGDWAKVECWNGWSGWLNGSLLVRRFTPTHMPPAGGLDAWDTPDPSAPPAARFGDGVELAVIEQQASGWAQVEDANGRRAWVDGRRLVERGATPPPQAPPPPPQQPQPQMWPPQQPQPQPQQWPPAQPAQPAYPGAYPGAAAAPAPGDKPRVDAPFGINMPDWWPAEIPVLAAAGALLVLLGSILPWWTYGFGSASAWDIPIFSLISNTNPPLSGLKMGLPLLAVLVVALPAITKKPLAENIVPIIGVAVVGLGVLTLARGLIGFSSGGIFGGSSTRYTFSPGLGLFISVAGGVLMGLELIRTILARMRS
jgi:hypothetical protein